MGLPWLNDFTEPRLLGYLKSLCNMLITQLIVNCLLKDLLTNGYNLYRSVWAPLLYIGPALASFQAAGMLPDLNDWFMMQVIGSASNGAASSITPA